MILEGKCFIDTVSDLYCSCEVLQTFNDIKVAIVADWTARSVFDCITQCFWLKLAPNKHSFKAPAAYSSFSHGARGGADFSSISSRRGELWTLSACPVFVSCSDTVLFISAPSPLSTICLLMHITCMSTQQQDILLLSMCPLFSNTFSSQENNV